MNDVLKILKVKYWEFKGYEQFVDLIKKKSKHLAPVLPSFLFKESLRIFCALENYETCMIIRDFAEANPERIREVSKEQWFNDEVIKVG